MTKLKVKGGIDSVMVAIMKENGKMINQMAKVEKSRKMEPFMKETSLMDSKKVKEHLNL